MGRKRVLAIGLDGATFDVIKPMVEAGRLPVISRLMREGAWGNLRSTVLPVTPPAWASFMTGKNPGKHGVYGFYASSEGTYKTKMTSGLSIKSRKLWDYLDGERVGLIDIPMTYPPEKVNGYMFSGWPVPADDAVFTHPPELHTEVIREVGEYMLDRTLAAVSRSNPIETLRALYRYTEMREKASLYLIEKKGPLDFFMVVFRGTDFIQHEAFKFHDEQYCRRHPELARKFKDVIYQFYEKMDGIIASLARAMGDDAVTVIMSDHGAGPMRKRFYINRWLRKEGFLTLNGASPGGTRMERKPVGELLQRAGAGYINTFMPGPLRRLRVPYPKRFTRHPSETIDWGRTAAFANLTWTDGVIRINQKGREPEGSVAPVDYERVRGEIIARLKAIKDPETGENIVMEAYGRDEVYSGPYLEEAPDILVLTTDTSHVCSPALDEGPILEVPEDPAPAPHRMDGVFVMHGPDIKPAQGVSGLSITDLAPTLLYLMGKAVPDEMDGRVIVEAIEDEYLVRNPLTRRRDEVAFRREGEGELSAQEKKIMEEGLKALGYME